jgi:hypothetical protein
MYGKKQQARLAGVALSEATRLAVGSDPANANASRVTQSQLLNRLLLEDTYPEFIVKSDCPLRVALAEDLTKLMKGPCLIEAQGFAGVALVRRDEATAGAAAPGQQAGPPEPLPAGRCLPLRTLAEPGWRSGSVNPWYVMIFLFVVLLSVGEAFYSPRLYEYTAAIAPKGQEASYMAMSSLPFFLAKLGVAPLLRRAAGPFLPGHRPAPLRNAVAAHRPEHDDRAGGVIRVPALHPRPRSGPG